MVSSSRMLVMEGYLIPPGLRDESCRKVLLGVVVPDTLVIMRSNDEEQARNVSVVKTMSNLFKIPSATSISSELICRGVF